MGEAVGPTSGRVLRIVRYPLVLAVIEFAVLIVAASFSSMLGHRFIAVKDTPLVTLGGLFVALTTIGVFILCRQAIEGKRGPGDFALAGAGKELGAGLALGFALFSAATGVIALLGGLTVIGPQGMGHLWSMLAMAVVSGVTEEVLFRGVLFRHLETVLGSWGALAITAALFGAGHLANPHASAFAAFAIAIEAGIMLGAAYMLTRRLWLAIGIHAAWNFTQGWIFSIPVSGTAAPVGLFASTRSGPDWLTGGAFGLEASVVALVVATAAGLVLLSMAVRRGKVMAPSWARKSVSGG
ncbi:MAG: hypothetical protein RLZZ136_7 [Pseudomonadota bacterium]